MHDKDDPFFDMDDERTIIKPNPRGRAPGPTQAARPQRSVDPGRKVDISSRPGLNPIEKAASTLLSLLSQIRNTSSHPNPNGLHKQLATEIQNFEKAAQKAGINEKTIFIARYALCTTIDEFVMTTPWGAGSVWGTQSLLSLFHKETRGGERFFQLLNKLSEDPSKNIDMLELLYLCLSLGFQGRYRVKPNGLNELTPGIRTGTLTTLGRVEKIGHGKAALGADVARCDRRVTGDGRAFQHLAIQPQRQRRPGPCQGDEYRPRGIPASDQAVGAAGARLYPRPGTRPVRFETVPGTGNKIRPGNGG